MINITDLHVIFNRHEALETHALRGINLAINSGEFVTVIGSNGAGKSTLLGAIAGDNATSQGKIHIDNVNVTRWPPYARARYVARVFQDPMMGTCANLTVEENLSMAMMRGRQRRLKQAINPSRRHLFSQRLAELGLGLENRLQDLVGQLSGGQRQALSLIMATLSDSQILLLDEHTAALDPRMVGFVTALTQRIYETYHLTILMVTHSMQAALHNGSRTLMLHQGNLILDISGKERNKMTVSDLLALFAKAAKQETDDDRLLLSA